MRLTPSVVALCTVFAGAARAQEAPGRAVDESAGYSDGYDRTASTRFDTALAAYGDWYDDPRFGRVWSPSVSAVGADFAPYVTAGSWSRTQYGWTFTSELPWGWGPFHYGRWVWLAAHRWAWVAGTAWGPAWVSWRTGDGVVGWAPLPPVGMLLAPPGADSPGWHFVAASQLTAAHPTWLAPAVTYPRTNWFNPTATLESDQTVVRYNPGPTGLAGSPATVALLGANALPHPDVAPPPPPPPPPSVVSAGPPPEQGYPVAGYLTGEYPAATWRSGGGRRIYRGNVSGGGSGGGASGGGFAGASTGFAGASRGFAGGGRGGR